MKIDINCPGCHPGAPTAAPDTAPAGTTAAPSRLFGVGTAATEDASMTEARCGGTATGRTPA
jgi:hypothetical protein